jgi:radical SAM-linked protein
VTFVRSGDAAALPARTVLDGWEAAVAVSGLPSERLEGAGERPRLQAGPPPPTGALAEEELFDLYLVERRTRAEVREALDRATPADHRITDLVDVWVRAPSPAACVVAADYRVELEAGGGDGPELLRTAVRDLLASDRLIRHRDRAGRPSPFDLRQLIVDVEVAGASDPTRQALAMRLRIDPQLGTGRPADVLDALREASGLSLQPAGPIVRGRLVLSGG